jgi:hypothetical protein
MAFKSVRLTTEEAAASGFTHKAIVTYTELASTASTSLAIALSAYTARTMFNAAAFKLVTAFDGTTTTSLTLKLGWNGATTDDDDGLITAVELHNDATEILGGDGNGAAFATLRTGYVALDAGNLEVTFTATAANLTDLTSGEVHIYWRQVDLAKL